MQYFVTKPSKKDPASLRVIRKFDDYETARNWASRYIFPDDHRLFIDDSVGNRLGIVEYNDLDPIVTEFNN